MNIRESLESLEEQYLSPFASFSNRTRGRAVLEPLCDIRPEYQRDRNLKAFGARRNKVFSHAYQTGGCFREAALLHLALWLRLLH